MQNVVGHHLGHHEERLRAHAEEARRLQALLHGANELDRASRAALLRQPAQEGRGHHGHPGQQGLRAHRQEGLRVQAGQELGLHRHEVRRAQLAVQAQVDDGEAALPQGPHQGRPAQGQCRDQVSEGPAREEGRQDGSRVEKG